MGFSVDWGNIEETILVAKIELRWTYEDYQQEFPGIIEALHSKDHTVDMIVDVRKAIINPPNLIGICRDALTQLTRFESRIVVITNSQFWQTLYTTIERMTPRLAMDIYFTRSVDEAYNLLEEAQQARQRAHNNGKNFLPRV